MTEPEQVVLLDESGHAIGTADKAEVHHRETPLHLAFSCYVFDDAGRLLLTQRALSKTSFPGVWTNSFCGHPSPGEAFADALHRRAKQEIGISLHQLQLIVPTFRYEASMSNGLRENEMCPVYVATTPDAVIPDPAEVEAFAWVEWATFRDAVLDGSRDVSSWCREQVAELAAREERLGVFAPGSVADLPPAAR